jgi:hypothetical protein
MIEEEKAFLLLGSPEGENRTKYDPCGERAHNAVRVHGRLRAPARRDLRLGGLASPSHAIIASAQRILKTAAACRSKRKGSRRQQRVKKLPSMSEDLDCPPKHRAIQRAMRLPASHRV